MLIQKVKITVTQLARCKWQVRLTPTAVNFRNIVASIEEKPVGRTIRNS